MPRRATIVRVARPLIGAVAFVYAILLIVTFAKYPSQTYGPGFGSAWLHLVIWTLGPPTWFAIEFWALSGEPERKDGSLKEGQDVAAKIWAAVLAVILYFYPDGPLYKLARSTSGPRPEVHAASANSSTTGGTTSTTPPSH